MPEKEAPLDQPPTISRGATLAHGCCGGLRPAAIFQGGTDRKTETALRLAAGQTPLGDEPAPAPETS